MYACLMQISLKMIRRRSKQVVVFSGYVEVCICSYYVFNNCVMAVLSVENEIFEADLQNLVSVRTKIFKHSLYSQNTHTHTHTHTHTYIYIYMP
jgi:hypothetical protein